VRWKVNFILDPSLVLYLPLYELNGASFVSKDAYGHLCTVTGALWRLQGRYFDGSDDRIEADEQLVSAYPFTLCGWIKADSSNTTANNTLLCLADKDDSARYYNIGVLLTSGKAYIFARNSTAVQLKEGTTDCFDAWYFITGVFTSATLRDIYVNETNEGTGATSVTYSTEVDRLSVGRMGDSTPSDYAKGLIGEVLVYNRALTPLEIQHNYLATKWRYR
jgi:hypothetical protein